MLKFLISPVICAFIGWLTNYLAIKMLFHPRREIKILWFKLQGIFPKRQKELALNLGEMIEKQLISHHDIKDILTGPEMQEKFKSMIRSHLKTFLKERLGGLNPMIAVFLNDQMLETIDNLLAKELDIITPQIMAQVDDELEGHLNIKKIVQEKVENLPMEQLEDLLFSIMKKEFKFIEVVGAVLGFAIGIFQSIFFLM